MGGKRRHRHGNRRDGDQNQRREGDKNLVSNRPAHTPSSRRGAQFRGETSNPSIITGRLKERGSGAGRVWGWRGHQMKTAGAKPGGSKTRFQSDARFNKAQRSPGRR